MTTEADNMAVILVEAEKDCYFPDPFSSQKSSGF